jgi:hypothetical protein
MRLLVVSQDFPPAVGGVQTWTDRVARALARSCEVTVLAPAAAGDEAHDATMPCPVLRWRNALLREEGVLADPGRDLPQLTKHVGEWLTVGRSSRRVGPRGGKQMGRMLRPSMTINSFSGMAVPTWMGQFYPSPRPCPFSWR